MTKLERYLNAGLSLEEMAYGMKRDAEICEQRFKELETTGKYGNIIREVHKNGNVRYRHQKSDNVAGVWMSLSDVKEKLLDYFDIKGSVSESYGKKSTETILTISGSVSPCHGASLIWKN